MITGMIGGQYITIDAPGGTYYNNSNMPMAGMLRYHSGGRTEVYDGTSWQTISGTAQVKLSPDATLALDWAIRKRAEEQELEELSQVHPAVRAALENMRKAEEQLKITAILSKDDQTTS